MASQVVLALTMATESTAWDESCPEGVRGSLIRHDKLDPRVGSKLLRCSPHEEGFEVPIHSWSIYDVCDIHVVRARCS